MVSKEMQNVISLLWKFRESAKDVTIKLVRAGMDQLGMMLKPPKDMKNIPTIAGNVPAEWITTPNNKNQKVILYLHGGGYVAGSIATYRDLISRISMVSKTRILILEYRLAPEFPFPSSIEDAVAAYKWLVSTEKTEPKNIIIAGDSAGGGLTLSTLIKLRDEAFPLPIAAICLSPWTDLAGTGDSLRNNTKIDPFISKEFWDISSKSYLKTTDPKNPLASPLYADLKRLPPILIQVGTSEVLLDDSIRFAERAKAAGVDVRLKIWKDMIHIFAIFAALAPESRQAIEEIGEFIHEFFK
jgi:monoterpene epsilon-lactone hydrolase